MIRYALVCDGGHAFDAWFRDSATFDVQNAGGQVGCPACRSTRIRKTLMAPAIRRSGRRDASEAPAPAEPAQSLPEVAKPASSPEPVMVLDEERFHTLRAALRELHARLKEGAEDVGRTFPDEARKIHDGEAQARAIYGTATQEEVRSLLEDGIDLLPLPALPEERN